MRKSLLNSNWVAGPDHILTRIILQGKAGEEMTMPALGGQLDDQQIASILTYVRRKWGRQAKAIDAATVAAVRKATAARDKPWTEEELLNLLEF